MESLIIHEEYLKYKEELEKLTEHLAKMVEEYTHKVSHEYHFLLTEYINKIGKLERTEFEYSLKALAIKRKMELARSYLNRQESPDEDKIDEVIQKEYKEYYERLEKMEKDIKAANLFTDAPVLSEEEGKELKSLYKQLVKKLHPDVKKEATEHDLMLWNHAVDSYEKGDLEMLRTIADIACGIEEKLPEEPEDAVAKLKEKCEKIRTRITEYMGKLSSLDKVFPFDKRMFLNDAVMVEMRRQELMHSIDEWKVYYKELRQKYKMLLNGECYSAAD